MLNYKAPHVSKKVMLIASYKTPKKSGMTVAVVLPDCRQSAANYIVFLLLALINTSATSILMEVQRNIL